jgi:hypothetical protein
MARKDKGRPTIRLSLACISAIFFFWMPVLFCLHYFFPHSGSLLIAISLILTGTVTLLGSVLYLSGIIDKRHRFYLAVPLCADALVIVIAASTAFLYGKSFLSDPINTAETIAIIALALLAPCSTALFYSLQKKESVTQVSTILSLAVSIFALFTILFVLRDMASSRSTIHAMLGLLGLYWYVGMPLIGICWIVNAISGRSRQAGH